MGGKVFRHVECKCSPITRENVDSTIKHLESVIFNNLDITFLSVGSTGKASLSNDLDIAVKVPANETRQSYRNYLHDELKVRFNIDAKIIGANLSFLFPIYEEQQKTNRNVQVDLFPVYDLQHAEWLLFSPDESHIKGVYRNLLFSWIAKNLIRPSYGENVSVKIGFPDGITLMRGKCKIYENVTNPSTITTVLDLEAKPESLLTFESLAILLKKKKIDMSDFLDYIKAYSQKDPEGYSKVKRYLTHNDCVDHRSL